MSFIQPRTPRPSYCGSACRAAGKLESASGVEHNEGTGHPGGELHGFQMWINLPRAHKMDAPAYNDISAAAIPTSEVAPGVTAKVLAGACGPLSAAVQPIQPIQYIDFTCEAGAAFEHADALAKCVAAVGAK